MKRDVTFLSQGLKCAGWLYVPDNLAKGERRPAIVMAHGFSAVKEMYLANFAEQFVAAGFVALVFDYRYFGDSEGEPRGRLIPFEQIEDYQNAITWTALQPEVDASRIGVWGTSYSGAHVLHLAAFDKRIKAVVAQVPLVNGWENAQRLMRPDVFAQFVEALAHDRAQRYTEGAINYVPVVAPEGQPSALPTPESHEWFTHAGQSVAPNWRNQVSLESMEKFLEYNPASNIHLISPTPLLMLVANGDTLTPTDLAIAAYQRAREPKSLVVMQGRHFDAYTEPGLSQSAPPAVEWFKRHLQV
ncbi:MAG: alpha/beta hydrolase [Ktedonobacteraceae bacterium]